MSWKSYTDFLLSQGHTKYAAIVGFEGGVWGTSDLKVFPAEGPALFERFLKPSSGAKLTVGGVDYIATACGDEFLTGKIGQTSLLVVRTTKALLIAVCPPGASPGTCLAQCAKMADYLKKRGF